MIQNSVCVCVVAVAGACMSSVIVAACRVLILQYLLTGAWDMGPSVLEVPQNKKPYSLHFFVTAVVCRHRTRLPSPSVVGCVCVLPPHEELA